MDDPALELEIVCELGGGATDNTVPVALVLEPTTYPAAAGDPKTVAVVTIVAVTGVAEDAVTGVATIEAFTAFKLLLLLLLLL